MDYVGYVLVVRPLLSLLCHARTRCQYFHGLYALCTNMFVVVLSMRLVVAWWRVACARAIAPMRCLAYPTLSAYRLRIIVC